MKKIKKGQLWKSKTSNKAGLEVFNQMKILCWLKSIWRSKYLLWNWDGFPVDGCDYVEKEIHENCRVTICKCRYCGKINISWEQL